MVLYGMSGFEDVPAAIVEWGYFVDPEGIPWEPVEEPVAPYRRREGLPSRWNPRKCMSTSSSCKIEIMRKEEPVMAAQTMSLVEAVSISVVTAVLVWCWLSYSS